jgi:ABC-type dipeptide/oligopeptide/nickel transport system permease subunit
VISRQLVIGAVLVTLLALLAIIGPHLASHDPIAADIDHGLSSLGAPLPPSSDALLGTDQLGRDVWARVLAGARISLVTATLATLLAMVLGVSVGLIAGYAGRRVDNLLMRLVDLVLSFPFLLLAILLAAVLRQSAIGTSITPVVLTIGLVSWTTTARVIRGRAVVLARSELVVAARGLGASGRRIIFRHLLPNVLTLVLVLTALSFAQSLLAEAALSFLGLGPPPPTPTWGRMLFDGRSYYRTAPWLSMAPGMAIVLAVVGFNLLGEGLREYFEVRK